MKSMKGLSVNKVLGSIRKKTSGASDTPATTVTPSPPPATAPGITPEVSAHNSVKAFCESGGNAKSDEVLFLPPIVDAAESSPSAAFECARLLRKYLSKDYVTRPSWQYNALMLLRILADNPGPTFTRNLDVRFVDNAKWLLKNSKDPSVRHLLMETLEDFSRTKYYDENLALLIQMWQREKEKALRDHMGRSSTSIRRSGDPSPAPLQPPRPSYSNNGYSPNYFSRHHTNTQLPDAAELSNRVEEARTSAKLLEQVVMNTPPAEILDNELIVEFANRCLSASRTIQGYLASTDPAPDNDMMESLIDTNEALQQALNQHQRAMLSARKQLGLYERSQEPSPAPHDTPNGSVSGQEWGQHSNGGSGSDSPAFPYATAGNGKGKQAAVVYEPPVGPPPSRTKQSSVDPGRGRAPPVEPPSPLEDPFEDPNESRPSFVSQEHYVEEAFHPGSMSDIKPFDVQYERPAAVNSHHEGGGSSSAAAGGSGSRPPAEPSEVSDDDLYSSSPKHKEPMYRY